MFIAQKNSTIAHNSNVLIMCWLLSQHIITIAKKYISKLLFILLLFCAFDIKAQIVEIPDTSFLNILLNLKEGVGYTTSYGTIVSKKIDLNNDGKIQLSEAEIVKVIYGSTTTTHSLKGIEAFKNLEYLSLSGLVGNGLDSLDLSSNTKLKYLVTQCGIEYINLHGLTQLDTLSLYDDIINIDLSTNTNLRHLQISSIFLNGLNLSKNTKLEYVSVASGGNITCLDVGNHHYLKHLSISCNALKHIKLNKELDLFSLGLNSLSKIDLSHCEDLTWISLSNIGAVGDSNSTFEVLDLSKQKKLISWGVKPPIKEVCLYKIDSRDLEIAYWSGVTLTQNCNTPSVSIVADKDQVCLGTPVNFNLIKPDIFSRYYLSFENGDTVNIDKLQHTFSSKGVYSVHLVENNECFNDTATTTVTVYQSPPQSIFDNYTCTKNAMVLDAGISYQHYQWQNGDTTQTLTVSQAGKYKLTASNICGSITDSTEVQFIKKELTISTPRLCVINEAEFDVQHIQYPVLNYHWAYGNGVTENSNQPKYKYLNAGTYNANLIVDYYCFKDTAATQVIVDDTPILNIGDSIITCSNYANELNAGAGYVSYLWQDGSKNQNYTATRSGIYTVAVTNTCGTQTDSVTIKKVQLDIPNIITPNNDGLNEVLQIKSQLPNPINLNIVNRWGSEVFNSTNYQNNWDANGLSDGIYYFTSNYEGCETVNGWVQVVR